MIKLNKLTDYAVVLLGFLKQDTLSSTADLARSSGLGEATVAKILKLLAKVNIVTSTRGAAGGYRLNRSLNDISMADLIVAIEGPLAVASCAADHQHGDACELSGCPVRGGWDEFNAEISTLLKNFSVARVVRQVPDFIRKEEVKDLSYAN